MNHLIFWKEMTLFLGSNPRAVAQHQHPNIQLVIGEKEAFLSKNANHQWEPKQGLLIAPNYRHECDAKDVIIISLDIDPEASFGEWIVQHFFQNKKLITYPSSRFPTFNFNVLRKNIESRHWDDLKNQIHTFFHFKPEIGTPKQYDPRIQAVIQFIAEKPDRSSNTKMLMDIAHLSESRLLHLFKEQVGLPIRNYIKWYRLQAALRYVLKGHNLTQAAHLAGFSDQAHLTRTSVNMLGIPPSFIVKNSKFVQVSIPD